MPSSMAELDVIASIVLAAAAADASSVIELHTNPFVVSVGPKKVVALPAAVPSSAHPAGVARSAMHSLFVRDHDSQLTSSDLPGRT